MLHGERATDIVAQAQAAGFSATARQLKRWHDEGLIPRPTQFCRKGHPGSEAIYPLGTSDQVLALCAIRRKFRRSKDCGWFVWWTGFTVETKFWKTALVELADWHDKSIAEFKDSVLTSHDRELSQKGFDVLSQLKAARTANPLFRRLRKRLGSEHFGTFIVFLIDILEGRFEGWGSYRAPDDTDLVRDKLAIDKGLGLFRARETAHVIAKPLLYDDAERALVLLSGRLGGVRLTEVLSDCDDKQIVDTRNELRALLMIAAHLTRLPGSKHPADQLGLNVLGQIANNPSLKNCAFMLMFLLTLKEDRAFQKSFGQFINLLRIEVLSMAPVERIDGLRRYDPALADFLCPADWKKAFQLSFGA